MLDIRTITLAIVAVLGFTTYGVADYLLFPPSVEIVELDGGQLKVTKDTTEWRLMPLRKDLKLDLRVFGTNANQTAAHLDRWPIHQALATHILVETAREVANKDYHEHLCENISGANANYTFVLATDRWAYSTLQQMKVEQDLRTGNSRRCAVLEGSEYYISQLGWKGAAPAPITDPVFGELPRSDSRKILLINKAQKIPCD